MATPYGKKLNITRDDEFYTVIHDLKSPLAVVDGYLEILQSSPRLNADDQRWITQILATTTRMKNMLDDLYR